MSKWSLFDHLTNHLARPRLGDEKHPTLWPSEASAVVKNAWGEEEVAGKCRRRTFFRFATANYAFNDEFSHLKPLVEEIKNKEIPVDPYMRWIWTAGELYEEYVVNLAKNSGVYIDSQNRVYIPDYNISGLIDLVVINPENFKHSVAEVKSVYGFNGNMVLGSDYERKHGKLGTPRDSNLMQTALYDYFFAKPRDYEDSRLMYGARDTGRYAEYRVRTGVENDIIKIWYRGEAPNKTSEVESPITITSILEDGYQYVTNHLLAGIVPKRDFEIKWSDEKIRTWYERDQKSDKSEQRLTKRERSQIAKIDAREKENEERVKNGKKPKKQLKPVEKGDWHCKNCPYKYVCYNKDDTPRTL